MRILLDTHILLWCLEENPSLPQKALKIIKNADEVYVSAASIWEITIKISIGKLELSVDQDELLQTISQSGMEWLAIKPEHAAKIIDLPNLHKDPFDRMLIAQSLVEPLQLISSEKLIAAYEYSNIVFV